MEVEKRDQRDVSVSVCGMCVICMCVWGVCALCMHVCMVCIHVYACCVCVPFSETLTLEGTLLPALLPGSQKEGSCVGLRGLSRFKSELWSLEALKASHLAAFQLCGGQQAAYQLGLGFIFRRMNEAKLPP